MLLPVFAATINVWWRLTRISITYTQIQTSVSVLQWSLWSRGLIPVSSFWFSHSKKKTKISICICELCLSVFYGRHNVGAVHNFAICDSTPPQISVWWFPWNDYNHWCPPLHPSTSHWNRSSSFICFARVFRCDVRPFAALKLVWFSLYSLHFFYFSYFTG